MEVRVFHVVQLCELTSTGCSQWAISLLYSLCIIFWMNIMFCEVSYLYIGLLTQPSYLTYVGFLNNSSPWDVPLQNSTAALPPLQTTTTPSNDLVSFNFFGIGCMFLNEVSKTLCFKFSCLVLVLSFFLFFLFFFNVFE